MTVIAVASELGIDDEIVRESLRRFAGVRRRFTKTGEWNGIAIIDDYGHHPVEIAAVLKAARAVAAGRVIAVVQPHRYTRLANLFDGFCTCFNDADIVLVADVYPAGEAPIDGASKDVKILGYWLAFPQHTTYLVVETDDVAHLQQFLKPGAATTTCEITPVSDEPVPPPA